MEFIKKMASNSAKQEGDAEINWKETMVVDSNEPLLTVGMPIYNGASTLTFALDSLLAQTYKNFQIIISDNASTDETREICERYQEKDKRIRYHRQEQNIGALHNFNYVLEIAETPLFMWAAHDDQWEPDFMKELMHLLMSNPTASLAFCAYDLFDPFLGNRIKGTKLRILANPHSPFTRSAVFLLRLNNRLGMMIYGIMPLQLLRDIGGFFSINNKEKDIAELPWSGEKHSLFLLGLRGGFVISDKILFHKGYRSDYLRATMDDSPTIKDMLTGYDIDKAQISRSGLPIFQQLILQLCALIYVTILLARRSVSFALDKMRLLFLFRRIRRRIITTQDPDCQHHQ